MSESSLISKITACNIFRFYLGVSLSLLVSRLAFQCHVSNKYDKADCCDTHILQDTGVSVVRMSLFFVYFCDKNGRTEVGKNTKFAQVGDLD